MSRIGGVILIFERDLASKKTGFWGALKKPVTSPISRE